jgi:hypothetical protein
MNGFGFGNGDDGSAGAPGGGGGLGHVPGMPSGGVPGGVGMRGGEEGITENVSMPSDEGTSPSGPRSSAMPTDEGGPNGPRLTSLFVGGFSGMRG